MHTRLTVNETDYAINSGAEATNLIKFLAKNMEFI